MCSRAWPKGETRELTEMRTGLIAVLTGYDDVFFAADPKIALS